MPSTHEALGFWGKRDEAKLLIQKMFFPLAETHPEAYLTVPVDAEYDELVDRLEQLVIEGSEEMRTRYGGRNEGV